MNNQNKGVENGMFLILLSAYVVLNAQDERGRNDRRWWVREANLSRNSLGYFKACFLKIKECDNENFFKHTRINREIYDLLLNILKEDLTKNSQRPSIEPECRLAVTLSYLSQGVSHQFLAWSYKMGKSTIRRIILNTCDIIWNGLSAIYVARPNKEDYFHIAKQFENKWDLPNCVGALDGKHISIQNPPHSGSLYYNYKSHFSIVLLAACDAQYCFTDVDIGAYGSQSNGGVLMNSRFGKELLCQKLPLPEPVQLPNSNKKFPYFYVGDPEFPLKENLMRPYPGKLLPREKRLFNYRISRAPVVIENAFGILVSRWRILSTKINCFPENAEKIVLAAVALHNFIKLNFAECSSHCPEGFVDREDSDGVIHPGDWRKDTTIQPNISKRLGSNNSSQRNFTLRDELKNYFINEGAIERQNKIL